MTLKTKLITLAFLFLLAIFGFNQIIDGQAKKTSSQISEKIKLNKKLLAELKTKEEWEEKDKKKIHRIYPIYPVASQNQNGEPIILKPEKSVELLTFNQLGLKLSAISSIGQNKSASISYQSQTKNYQINQLIDEYLILSQIEDDFVIINYHQKPHKLTISANKNSNRVATYFKHSLKDEEKKMVLDFQKKLITNPHSLQNMFSIRYHNKGGIVGFKINPNENRKLFDGLGLKRGDVLISLNGIAITQRKNLFSLYNSLASSKRFVVKVFRKNKVIEYLINLS